MSAFPVEAATEPDPSATSLPNDQTLNKDIDDATATTEKISELSDAVPAEANGSIETKEDGSEEKPEKNGAAKGDHSPRSKRRSDNVRKNNSKYDPSVLEATSDHSKIRAQVRCLATYALFVS